MKKIKAVVLEKSGSSYTLLGQDGTFRRVHKRLDAEVGEEVLIQPWPECFSRIYLWAGSVAVLLLVLTSILGWNLYQAPTAVALMSVDINPSMQFTLDNQGHLLEFKTQDEDAKRMLNQIDLKGKPIVEALDQIVSQAYEQKFLGSEQHWVVIGYSPMAGKTMEQLPKELNENQIISCVTAIGEKKGLPLQVAVFSLTAQEQEIAHEGNLTLGEYALWQTADKAGVATQPEKLKDTSEQVKLLENPQVQERIKSVKKETKPGLSLSRGVAKKEQDSTVKLIDKEIGKQITDRLSILTVRNNEGFKKQNGQYKNKELSRSSNKGLINQTKKNDNNIQGNESNKDNKNHTNNKNKYNDYNNKNIDKKVINININKIDQLKKSTLEVNKKQLQNKQKQNKQNKQNKL